MIIEIFAVSSISLASAAYYFFRQSKTESKKLIALNVNIETKISIRGRQNDYLKVLTAPDLLKLCRADVIINKIYTETRLTKSNFARDFLPAIHAYAEFVQLFPASESHHHAHVGGLLEHTLDVLSIAMQLRNAYLLPQGGGAEIVDAQRDVWTYAIFAGALLHDVGKPVTDLKVTMVHPSYPNPVPWMGIAGSLVRTNAIEYRVGFPNKNERDYQAHKKLSVQLMQSMLPSTMLSFLGLYPEVMAQLIDTLQGNNTIIAEIIRKSDMQSTAKNLGQGSRAKFLTSVQMPLVDILMLSLRAMLKSSELPLNRDGAAGWVKSRYVYFVSKRLADAVRDYAKTHYPDQNLPGPDKNDRFFDTWQEYNVVDKNPDSQQAIWRINVTGEDYQHEFTVLKFPLNQLYDEKSYPKEFDGQITELLSKKRTEPVITNLAESDQLTTIDSEPDKQETNEDMRNDITPNRIQKKSESVKLPKILNKKDIASILSEDEFKNDADSAKKEAEKSSENKQQDVNMVSLDPVAPKIHLPALLKPELVLVDGEPNAIAITFMKWLQQGLSTGSLLYNDKNADVHFVNEGMALVSPKIFKKFASEYETDQADINEYAIKVQRAIVDSGWNAVGPKKSNIFKFEVKHALRPSLLSAVIILQPERFIMPVPPNNPALELKKLNNS